jgi:hypothetical protein
MKKTTSLANTEQVCYVYRGWTGIGLWADVFDCHAKDNITTDR